MTVVKVYKHDLLPGAQGKSAVDEGDCEGGADAPFFGLSRLKCVGPNVIPKSQAENPK